MYRVLIVDDHAAVRQGVRQLLDERFDLDAPGEASNADEAIEMVQHDRWDVVILDVNMPGKGGMEALKAMKRSNPGLPIIMFSVFPPEQVARRFLAAGASGYVSKGGSAEDLVSAVRRAVGGGSNGPIAAGAVDSLNPDDAVTAWHL